MKDSTKESLINLTEDFSRFLIGVAHSLLDGVECRLEDLIFFARNGVVRKTADVPIGEVPNGEL